MSLPIVSDDWPELVLGGDVEAVAAAVVLVAGAGTVDVDGEEASFSSALPAVAAALDEFAEEFVVAAAVEAGVEFVGLVMDVVDVVAG